MKVFQALKFLTQSLENFLGPERAKREALEILAHLLNIPPLNLWLNLEREVPDEAVQNILQRRLKGEPLAYILGVAYFFGRPFVVKKGVLIPRPETEVLVEFFLEHPLEEGLILDLGIGSGIIAITLLREREGLKAVGVDISPLALAIASVNAYHHQVAERLFLLRGKAFSPLRQAPLFSAIVSNPPYLSEEEYENLSPEVKDFEPKEALVSGRTGLEFHELILKEGFYYLKKEGFILLELGYNQAEEVKRLALSQGLRIEFRKDLLGYKRCAKVWRE